MLDLQTLITIASLVLAIGLGMYVAILRSNQNQQQSTFSELTNQLEQIRMERDQALQRVIRLETELDSERKQVQHRIDSLNEAKEALTNQFKNLANEILEDKTKKFTEQNAQQLDILLKPLQTKLTEFKDQVSNSYEKESRERFALKHEIERLANLNLKMSDEARSLTNALKGDSKIQGNWGELILESILESSGLRKGEELVLAPR
jgi:DNA recombination protein RmuC